MSATTTASRLLLDRYYTLASLIVLAYDTLVTISIEVEKIWKRKFTGLTILWFLNRWYILLAMAPFLAAFFEKTWTEQNCSGFYMYPIFIAASQRLIVGTIFTLRTYCIYECNIWIASVVGSLALADVAMKILCATWTTPLLLPPSIGGCYPVVSPIHMNKFFVFWLMEFITDSTVLFLTLFRSYVVYWESRHVERMPLWEVILKDGIMYFVIMFASNLMSVIFYLVLPVEQKFLNEMFRITSTSILVARLILNLRAVAARQCRGSTLSGDQTTPTLAWEARYPSLSNAIWGNIGNDLGSEMDADVDDEYI